MLWYLHIKEILIDRMGFSCCPACYCLFIKIDKSTSDFMIICIHVDDGLMAFNRDGMEKEFIDELNKYLRKASLTTGIKKYLGTMELEKLDNYIKVHHSSYIQSIDLLDINNDCKRTEAPMSPNVNQKSI